MVSDKNPQKKAPNTIPVTEYDHKLSHTTYYQKKIYNFLTFYLSLSLKIIRVYFTYSAIN
jgi:hypothetical protein